jgi:hypothetical protein
MKIAPRGMTVFVIRVVRDGTVPNRSVRVICARHDPPCGTVVAECPVIRHVHADPPMPRRFQSAFDRSPERITDVRDLLSMPALQLQARSAAAD